MWAFSELPIVQAPMAGAQGAELCIAVCQSGGLGSIPARDADARHTAGGNPSRPRGNAGAVQRQFLRSSDARTCA